MADGDDTAAWATNFPALTQKLYSGDDLVNTTDDGATDLTAAASASTAAGAWVLYSNNLNWDSTAAVFPGHVAYRMMPEETASTDVRIELAGTYTVAYDASAYASTAQAVTVTIVLAETEAGTFAAASSLAAAATVVVAASLF